MREYEPGGLKHLQSMSTTVVWTLTILLVTGKRAARDAALSS